jgi:hypothetical protein
VSSVRATSGTKGVNLPVDAGATMVAP